jgi:hypothetical protein
MSIRDVRNAFADGIGAAATVLAARMVFDRETKGDLLHFDLRKHDGTEQTVSLLLPAMSDVGAEARAFGVQTAIALGDDNGG